MAGNPSTEVNALREAFQHACGDLDPDSVPTPEVEGLYAALDHIEKLAAGAKLRLVRRLDEAPLGFGPGVRSTDEEIARRSGTSVREVQEAIKTSARLQGQAGTDAALRRGELSAGQATMISDAAGSDVGAERALLATAQHQGLSDLRRQALETKARADADAAARRERIRRNRSCRRWVDADGTANLHLRDLPEHIAEIETLLAPFTQAAYDTARKAGVREPHEAYRADGMLAMARATAKGGGCDRPKGASRTETKVFVHIDLDTLTQGRSNDGSVCRIDGVGPVDVTWVRSILGDAFVVALLEDRVGVRDVVHLGRKVTAHQRSALEARGHHCEVPGCAATHGLEIDHITGWTVTRTTQLDDLIWLCSHHHDQKTHRGARLSGPPGERTWHPPPPKTRPGFSDTS